MTKHLTLLLFIGLAWGQGLWLANMTGDTIVIVQGERFILNVGQNTLLKVDYQNQTIIVKKGLMRKEKNRIAITNLPIILQTKNPTNVGLIIS